MKTVWVVVADEAIARILQWPEVGDELEPVEELTDPGAHADAGELRRDAYGRRSGSATHSARPTSPHRLRSTANVTSSAGEGEQHQEAALFAKRVAEHLEQSLRAKRFDALQVVAAPRFLGLLRKAMGTGLAAAVTDEINKDLIHASNAELTQRLAPAAAAAHRPAD